MFHTHLLRLLSTALLGATALMGCSSDTTTATSQKALDVVSPPFNEPRPTDKGGYFVACRPIPDPIPMNKIFGMEVRVYTWDKEHGKSPNPATGVTVRADAGMPAHNHGMNLTPRVSRAGDGMFKVEGMLFHMPGAWRITVDVVEAGKTERATFDVEVR